jgi:DNA primase
VNEDVWHCFGCNAGGDVFTLHAILNKTSPGQAIKDLGVKLGLRADTPAPSFSEQLETFLKRQKKKEDKVRESEKAQVLAKEMFNYDMLPPLSKEALFYLNCRGIDEVTAQCLLEKDGRLFLPLYDFTGEIVNAIGRSYTGQEPKVWQIPHGNVCGTFGNFAKNNPARGCIIVEGVFDYLSVFSLAPWGGHNLYGVHSCSNIPKVCIFMANGVRDSFVKFVVHNDNAGREAVDKGCRDLINMGVAREKIQIINIPDGCNDLNEYLVKNGFHKTRELLSINDD